MKIEIFTDGACSGNPGKGGFGVLMRVAGTNYQKTFSQGFRRTTNNRMELSAVIFALNQLKDVGHELHIYTDSKYVSDAINQKWILGWAKRGFTKIKNSDLWRELYVLYQRHQPKFHWVKGHNGHMENEMVDDLAVKASQSEKLLIDIFFENGNDTLF